MTPPAPPAIIFAFGTNEDSQCGTENRGDLLQPGVIDQLMGVSFAADNCASPIVAGARNTIAVDADGGVRAVMTGGPCGGQGHVGECLAKMD